LQWSTIRLLPKDEGRVRDGEHIVGADSTLHYSAFLPPSRIFAESLTRWTNVDVRAVGIAAHEQRKPFEDRRGRNAVESRKHPPVTQDTDIASFHHSRRSARNRFRSSSEPLPLRHWPSGTMLTPARRIGGGLEGVQASPTANLNTESRTASSPFVRLQPQWTAIPVGAGLRARDNEALRGPRAGARGKAFAKFSFSPKGTEVIESVSGAIPNFDQVPGPTRHRRHSLLCRRLCQ
jgi:hypothetical protein